MVKQYDCTKCGGFHPRPINRNCQANKGNNADKDTDTNSQILNELKLLSAHAVLLCQMEEGLRCDDNQKIDRIHRAHAQKISSMQGVKRPHVRESATPC